MCWMLSVAEPKLKQQWPAKQTARLPDPEATYSYIFIQCNMAVSLPPVDISKGTVKHNLFSKHDNRHTLQSCGEYFGQGLGKRIEKDPVRNQHRSDDHTSWGSQLKYSSTYRQGYGSEACEKHRRSLSAGAQLQSSTLTAGDSLLGKFHVLTKPNFRRFPHKHSLPDNFTNARSEDLVSTMLWYNDRETTSRGDSAAQKPSIKSSKSRRLKSYTTPLGVLAATQQPFLGHSPWKYSYKQ